MAYRFASPPGWPPPPPGWTPPPEWTPDPSWPAAPAGWRFWVEVSDAAPTPTAPLLVPPHAHGRRLKRAEADVLARELESRLAAEIAARLATEAELGRLRDLEHAELVAETTRRQAVEAELSRVRGLEHTELVAETARVGQELVELRSEIARDRVAWGAESAQRETRRRAELSELTQAAEREATAAEQRRDRARGELDDTQTRLRRAREQIVTTDDIAMLQEVGVYDYRHPLADAVAYRAALKELTDRIKSAARAGQAVRGNTNWTVNGSAVQGRRMVTDFSKLMLRAYNAEADNGVRTMRPYRLHSLLERLAKARETIARLGRTMDIRITDSYHQLRCRELELTADFLAKQDEEKERRRELRELQREEEARQREIAHERSKLTKEREQYLGALARMRASGSVSDEVGVRELQTKLTEIETALDAVNAREANIRAGYVYVISNIGAFGEHMVKVGLTRRLQPLDRVTELGDASVPFRFDVHALIFSDDAVSLEHRLHQELAARRVNRVNQRREFFYATPADVRDILSRLDSQYLLEFREQAEAPEWRASQAGRVPT